MEHKTKTVPVAHFKTLDETEGIAEMIVSVFGNVDFAKERCNYGCFAKSLKKKLPKGVWMHDWSQPVAKTLEAEELRPGDPRLPEEIKKNGGLYIKGQFNLGTQRGRDAFSDLCFGTVDEFSFGYDIVQADYDSKGVLDLKELDIHEWSPVLLGCNAATALLTTKGFSVSDIKALKDALRIEFAADKNRTVAAGPTAPGTEKARDWQGVKAQYLGDYAEGSATMSVIYELYYALLYGPIWDTVYGDFDEDADDGTIESRANFLRGAFDEFRDMSITIFTTLMNSGASAADGETMKALVPPTSDAEPTPVGAKYQKQLETALAAVEACVERGKSIHAIRAKDGRSFSNERREQIKGLQNAVGALLSETAPQEALSEVALKQIQRKSRLRSIGAAVGEN